MKRKKVSVAMAAYNGEEYIKNQIDSILPQLQEEDELVISLDSSFDNTENILSEYVKNDSRIVCIPGPNKGALKNFENAIYYAKNEIIFLADQDDVWLPGKVEQIVKKFEDADVQVVMHDAKIVDSNLNVIEPSFFSFRNVQIGIKQNILKNSYIGCCMAFNQKLKKKILPFPEKIPMHDQWIGLVGELEGKNILIPEIYLLYRRHESNETGMKHSSLVQMFTWRKNLIKEIRKYKLKKNKYF